MPSILQPAEGQVVMGDLEIQVQVSAGAIVPCKMQIEELEKKIPEARAR